MALTTAGQRRALVTVMNPTRVVDSEGGYTDTYTPATPATLWVKLEPFDGAERQHAGIIDATISHRVTAPYHAGITTQTRLVYGTRTLVIKAVRDPEERQTELELFAAEVSA